MFARVARFEGGDPRRLDDVIAGVREELRGPPPEGLEGARGVWMLVDRENGVGLGITLFDTEEDLRRGDEALNRMSPGEPAGRRASVEIYEVAVREDDLGG